MTTKTRYFVIVSLLMLASASGPGWLPITSGSPPSAFASRGGLTNCSSSRATPPLVAYADVHDIMTSDLRQKLRSAIPMQENGQHEFQNQTGINIETDIDHVVAAFVPTGDATGRMPGSAMVLARGRFDEVKIEALMREHGAQVEDYKGKRAGRRRHAAGGHATVSLAFLEPGLVAVG